MKNNESTQTRVTITANDGTKFDVTGMDNKEIGKLFTWIHEQTSTPTSKQSDKPETEEEEEPFYCHERKIPTCQTQCADCADWYRIIEKKSEGSNSQIPKAMKIEEQKQRMPPIYRIWVPFLEVMSGPVRIHQIPEFRPQGLDPTYMITELDREQWVYLLYSGWNAANGQWIWEGDIVELLNEDRRRVRAICRFGNAHRVITTDTNNICDIRGFHFLLMHNGFKSMPVVRNYARLHDTKIMTVIGNVYQSPELIGYGNLPEPEK